MKKSLNYPQKSLQSFHWRFEQFFFLGFDWDINKIGDKLIELPCARDTTIHTPTLYNRPFTKLVLFALELEWFGNGRGGREKIMLESNWHGQYGKWVNKYVYCVSVGEYIKIWICLLGGGSAAGAGDGDETVPVVLTYAHPFNSGGGSVEDARERRRHALHVSRCALSPVTPLWTASSPVQYLHLFV